jgi:hypothetical protein
VGSESNDDRFIRRSVFFMVTDLCRQMRRERLFPRAFCLRFVYRDNYHTVMAGKLKNPCFFEKPLYRELEVYLNRALKRRTCMKKITLSLSRFSAPFRQLSLFQDSFRMERLAGAFDLVEKRFGKNSLRYGA